MTLIRHQRPTAPVKADSILSQTLQAIYERSGLAVPPARAIPIDGTAHYAYDTATGWAHGLTHTRTIRFGPNRDIERLEFQILVAEAR